MRRIAILDDYQGVALQLADWSSVADRAELVVFREPFPDEATLVEKLAPFDVLCVMRERTPLPRTVLERLPRLRLTASTGRRNASIDTAAAAERGIAITHTDYSSAPTIEYTWALLLGSARHLASESASVRAGGWQTHVGLGLRGRTLSVLGLGNIGSEVARIALAFGMRVIAWSENLTAERAAAVGAELVTKERLFAEADFLTVHLVLSKRSRGLVDAALLASMKPTATLVNTSRGPIVDEAALVEALRGGRLAAAALDVFDHEPLPSDHPFRSLPNVLATPHLGYVTDDMYRTFYGDVVSHVSAWLDDSPA